MALPDPMSIAISQSAGALPTGVSSNFRRVSQGRYVATDGAYSQDQPAEILISSKPKFGAAQPSVVNIKVMKWKNVAPINGVPQSDDKLVFDCTVQMPLRSFTQPDLVELINSTRNFLETYGARIIAGEV